MAELSIDVSFNGELCRCDAPNLLVLLAQRGHDGQAACACAVNQVFVPRSQWPHTVLRAGDRIDLVAPVTGG